MVRKKTNRISILVQCKHQTVSFYMNEQHDKNGFGILFYYIIAVYCRAYFSILEHNLSMVKEFVFHSLNCIFWLFAGIFQYSINIPFIILSIIPSIQPHFALCFEWFTGLKDQNFDKQYQSEERVWKLIFKILSCMFGNEVPWLKNPVDNDRNGHLKLLIRVKFIISKNQV